jgi:hypothetical protein
MFASGATNVGIQTYFNTGGQSALGDPLDRGRGAWVYSYLNGYAQDFEGGSHGRLFLMSSTNGTFELNDVHGLWSYYTTNNGSATLGFPLSNEFGYGPGTRQNFSYGYLTWNAAGGVLWYPAGFRPLLSASPRGVMSWSGTYWLQSATNPPGIFVDVPGATSPYTNRLSGMAPEFYRLRN